MGAGGSGAGCIGPASNSAPHNLCLRRYEIFKSALQVSEDPQSRGRRHLVKVAAFDYYNTDTAVYNGPYEITLTDITGVQQMVIALSEGTTRRSSHFLSTADMGTADIANRFTTGAHADGYTLDRIKVVFYDIREAGATPDISIHEGTSDAPGDKVCDIAVPNLIAESQVDWSSTPPHTFLAPDCADDTLAASTTYWIVFSDVDHSEYEIGNSFGLNVKDYYGSGWNTINEVAKRGASNDWALDQGVLRVGFWASEN